MTIPGRRSPKVVDQPGVYRLATACVRPLLAHPFPGRWRVFGRLINQPRYAAYWANRPVRWTRCKITGFQIPCDLATFSGRIAWHFRRWYELDTQSAIMSLVPRGGVFIDIGANVGMATLSAAAVAGPNGTVVAFEPNPAVAKILSGAVARNGLAGVVALHRAAVARTSGTMTMFVPADNHGEATLALGPTDRPGRMIDVAVTDAAFLADLDRIDLVKIDVEGFELTVLQALAEILTRHRPPVICELMDEHLRRANTSARAVLTYVETLGYRSYELRMEHAGPLRQRAALSPVSVGRAPVNRNVLLLPEEREAADVTFVALAK